MNSINRLKESWTPKWDLGLQDEFGFLVGEDERARSVELSARPRAWAMASREVLNRQSPVERGVASEMSSLGDLITFFEALSVEIASNE